MSWTHYGNRGTAQNKTSSATLTLAPTATVAVGRLLIIWTAWDSHRGTDYPISYTFDVDQTKLTDSQGNIYVQLFSASLAQDNTHVRGGLFISRIRTQLTTADTITITSKTAVVAKCASMHEFGSTLTGWCRWPFFDRDNWTTAQGDVPDLVQTTMTSQEYLMLHILAVEGPNTDAYTWDPDYTQITGTGTTGGADDENVHIRGSFRIATLTTDTVSITSDTADRDLTHALIPLCEVNIPPLFPQYEILDDANRANENPLSFGGMWLKSSGGGLGTVPGGITNADLKVDSNQFKVAHSHIDSYGKYYWQDDIPCGYSEAWATLSANPTASIAAQGGGLPDTNPGVRGIGVAVGSPDSGPFSAAVHLKRKGKFQVDDLLWLHNPASGIRTMAFVGALAAGMRIGVQQEASRYYHAWIDQNGGNGWEWLVAHDWGTQSFTHPFRPVLWVSGTESAADNFGGGHRCFPGDIIRRRS